MATEAITKLVNHARSMQHSLQNIRAKHKETEKRLVGALCNVGGGVLGGVVDGKLGGGETHTILGAPTVLIGGMIVAAAGLTGLLPASEAIADTGLGAVSYGLGNLIRNKLSAG
jgi:hypothetical protein